MALTTSMRSSYSPFLMNGSTVVDLISICIHSKSLTRAHEFTFYTHFYILIAHFSALAPHLFDSDQSTRHTFCMTNITSQCLENHTWNGRREHFLLVVNLSVAFWDVGCNDGQFAMYDCPRVEQ